MENFGKVGKIVKNFRSLTLFRPISNNCVVCVRSVVKNGVAEAEGSSIVNRGYPDNLKPVFFFLFVFLVFFEEKISRAQKHVTSENQLTKKKKLALNNKDNNFSRAQNFQV